MKIRLAGIIILTLSASTIYAGSESAELKILKAEKQTYFDGSPQCEITSSLTNKTSISFQSYSPKVQYYDVNGYLIDDATYFFKNVRPGKTSTYSEVVENSTCEEIDKIVVEKIHYCEHGGKFWNGCEKYLVLLDGVKPLKD